MNFFFNSICYSSNRDFINYNNTYKLINMEKIEKTNLLNIFQKKKKPLKILLIIIIILHFFDLAPIINGVFYGECETFIINKCINFFDYICSYIISTCIFIIGLIYNIKHFIDLNKTIITKKEIKIEILLLLILEIILIFHIILFIINTFNDNYPLQKITLDPSVPLGTFMEIISISLIVRNIILFLFHGIKIIYLIKTLKKI
jgi:hypothetical protein